MRIDKTIGDVRNTPSHFNVILRTVKQNSLSGMFKTKFRNKQKNGSKRQIIKMSNRMQQEMQNVVLVILDQKSNRQ